MESLKKTFLNHKYLKYSLLIGGNAAFLYALYFIIKNFDLLWSGLWAFLSGLFSALSPLWIGLIIAYIFSPLVVFFNRHLSKLTGRLPAKGRLAGKWEKGNRLLSVLLSLILVFLLIFIVVYGLSIMILGNLMVEGLSPALNSIIEYAKSYENVLQNWVDNLPEGQLSDKIQDLAQSIVNWLAANFKTQSVVDFFVGVGGSIVNMILGIVVSIYLLYDKELFLSMVKRASYLLFPKAFNHSLTTLLGEVNIVFSLFIRGALLDALIIGILSSIILTVIGLDFSVFIGLFAGLCNIIPYFGPLIGMIPAFIVGTFTEGMWMGLLAVLSLFILQQIDANLIYPKIVGAQTGLHPLFVLIAVSFAAFYWGIPGMIIAVPLAGTLKIFLVRWAKVMSEKKDNPHN